MIIKRLKGTKSDLKESKNHYYYYILYNYYVIEYVLFLPVLCN